jgi:single-strand DNA-binding protein
MVNKVILLGRVGRNPEVRYAASGAAVANFSIATTETWKDKSGAKQEKTEWHKITAWNRLGEICGEYVSKGMMLYIEGKLTTRSWEDKSGEKKYSTEVIADSIKMLGGGKPKETPQNGGGAPPPPSSEDIPF